MPFFDGAREFIHIQKGKGNKIVIVSDSHPKYVKPVCEELGCDCVCLAKKPNTLELSSFLDSNLEYKRMVQAGNAIFIGDTVLDIELSRRLGLPSIWILQYRVTDDIKDCVNKVGDEMAILKMGPTYAVKSFAEINEIIDNPIDNLYVLESIFNDGKSLKSIKYSQNKFRDKSFTAIRCLARQESGICDKYARADKYYQMSLAKRSQELVKLLANGVSRFLNQPEVSNLKWDYITYITDKQTTIPLNKMKEIFDLIETPIAKIKLLAWSESVKESIRSKNLYDDRKDFLEKNLMINEEITREQTCTNNVIKNKYDILDKNIIVIDDQLTTSATAWHIIHKLKEKGARNILFIALFQMILPIESDVLCPRCGKPMFIKIRRLDGHKFYSCTPPQFRGNGCGFVKDIQN